jgi:hypothetical protein
LTRSQILSPTQAALLGMNRTARMGQSREEDTARSLDVQERLPCGSRGALRIWCRKLGLQRVAQDKRRTAGAGRSSGPWPSMLAHVKPRGFVQEKCSLESAGAMHTYDECAAAETTAGH